MSITSLPDGIVIDQTSNLHQNSDGTSSMKIVCHDDMGQTHHFGVLFYPNGRPPLFVQIISGCMEHPSSQCGCV